MAERTPPKWLTIGALGLIVALALVVRLIVGSQVPLDADESVEAITAIHILHGHVALMESNARYLGALDSYVLVPFIALFGTTVTAIRIAFAIVGAAFVGLMFFLGRVALPRDREDPVRLCHRAPRSWTRHWLGAPAARRAAVSGGRHRRLLALAHLQRPDATGEPATSLYAADHL